MKTDSFVAKIGAQGPIVVQAAFASSVAVVGCAVAATFGNGIRFPGLLAMTAAGSVAAVPYTVWLHRQQRLDSTHPASIAFLVFLLPAFIVGSALVACGFVAPRYLERLKDPAQSLLVSQLLIFVGALSLLFGAYLSYRTRSQRRPLKRRIHPSELGFVGLALYTTGFVASVVGLIRGDSGYRSAYVSGLGTAIVLASTLQITGTAMLWQWWLRTSSNLRHWFVMFFVAMLPVQTLVTASRGVAPFMVGAALLSLALTRVRLGRSLPIFGALGLVGALIIGFVFGSGVRFARGGEDLVARSIRVMATDPGPGLRRPQLRNLEPKDPAVETTQEQTAPPLLRPAEETEASPSSVASLPVEAVPDPIPVRDPERRPARTVPGSDNTTNTIPGQEVLSRQVAAGTEAVSVIRRRGAVGNMSFVFRRVTERLDHIASVAVIVGQYEGLREEERRYGLDNSVRNTLAGSLIPRMLWKEKPLVNDARAIGLVYFGDGSNSYVSTPMTDLLRNGGWPAVVGGMTALGFLLGRLFDWFGQRNAGFLAHGLYVTFVLRVMNFEASFGGMFAEGLRVMVTVLCVGFGSVTALRAWRRMTRQRITRRRLT